MIGSSAVLGAVISSLFAGKIIIKLGRRKSLLIFNFIASLAVISTLFLNFYALCFGRLLFGFCGGIFQVVQPRMIEETVPHHLLSRFGIISNLSINAG